MPENLNSLSFWFKDPTHEILFSVVDLEIQEWNESSKCKSGQWKIIHKILGCLPTLELH